MTRKPKRSSAASEIRADSLIRQIVFNRDFGRCRFCGGQASDVHHIIHRRYKAVRWDARNLISLCRICHDREQNRNEVKRFKIQCRVEVYHNGSDYDELNRLAESSDGQHDIKGIIENLERELEG
jgi:hypothetical protein